MGQEQPPSTASPCAASSGGEPPSWQPGPASRTASQPQACPKGFPPSGPQNAEEAGGSAFLHRTLRATWGRPPPPRVGGRAGLHSGLISSHQTPGGSGPPQPTRMSGPRPASGSFLDRFCQEHGPDPRSDGPGGGLRGWACPPPSQLSWAPISLGKPLASETVLGGTGWLGGQSPCQGEMEGPVPPWERPRARPSTPARAGGRG